MHVAICYTYLLIAIYRLAVNVFPRAIYLYADRRIHLLTHGQAVGKGASELGVGQQVVDRFANNRVFAFFPIRVVRPGHLIRS